MVAMPQVSRSGVDEVESFIVEPELGLDNERETTAPRRTLRTR